MIRYKKLNDYSKYKIIYDSVYDDGKSLYNWNVIKPALLNKSFKLYSILEDDMIIGTCGFSGKDHNDVTIYELMIHEDYQGMGYGSRVLNYTLSQIKRLKSRPELILAYTNELDFFESNEFYILERNDSAIEKYTMYTLI